MAFDAFMIVKVKGSEVLKGESVDEEFSKLGASEILEFSFSSSEAGSKIRGILEGKEITSSIAKTKTEDELEDEKRTKLKMSVSKYLDSASPGLLKAYCQISDRRPNDDYKPFESVILNLRKAGGSNPLRYLMIELDTVDVSSYALESGSGNEPPRENLTLSFETFKVEYTSQSTTGLASGMSKTSIMGWDFENNKAK
jgi:type VI protein secretion system component Hcp